MVTTAHGHPKPQRRNQCIVGLSEKSMFNSCELPCRKAQDAARAAAAYELCAWLIAAGRGGGAGIDNGAGDRYVRKKSRNISAIKNV
ncbi:hypothetical protein EVAR_22050_1 [Eumeta japonica]|uniref:Uncharacterized protein n=1 Tax=Eumeta variegata TaxID=151549 RepID=A0A4C1USL4_EUMVA|nr:hypothetical protein EVAR_22050_1 [Eumeta japonica]